MEAAKRLEGIGEYYFSRRLRELEVIRKSGVDVINLGIGSPDGAPHATVIDTLVKAALKPSSHAYQGYKGQPVLRKAIRDWYARWYQVSLNEEEEILPLAGSKEGILQLSLSLLNEGDEVLIPDPGYPTYAAAALIAGGKIRYYSLKEELNYYPDFTALQNEDLSKVKLMWVNYPHMPTGAPASTELFKNLIQFGKRNNILICHDNPYSFILNERPLSILAVPGAIDTAIELNSLSKSHNMAGWRVGMLCGRKEIIDEVLRFTSNQNSGMFLPLQLAAVEALGLDDSWYADLNEVYRRRQSIAVQIMETLKTIPNSNNSGMFIWAKVSAEWRSGRELSDRLVDKTGVFITPGEIFGEEGKNYLRISLCTPEERLIEALQRIKTFEQS